VGDIRKIGSGNIGATNMLRTGKKWLAAVTLLLDFAKGILGIATAQGLYNYFFTFHGGRFTIAPSISCLAGAAAVVGHVFPVWLKFKGGKGVATTLGVFIALNPLIGILTMLGWILFFYLTRTSSLAAIGSLVGAPFLALRFVSPTQNDFIILTFLLSALVIYKHKDNIKRLREGNESKWEKKDDSA
jgi:glycerol-3-phosphate acyltransferase PlsY